jgi:hypothetical protein
MLLDLHIGFASFVLNLYAYSVSGMCRLDSWASTGTSRLLSGTSACIACWQRRGALGRQVCQTASSAALASSSACRGASTGWH